MGESDSPEGRELAPAAVATTDDEIGRISWRRIVIGVATGVLLLFLLPPAVYRLLYAPPETLDAAPLPPRPKPPPKQKPEWALVVPQGAGDLRFAPDGQHVVSDGPGGELDWQGVRCPEADRKQVVSDGVVGSRAVWDVQTGLPVLESPVANAIVAESPDGAVVVVRDHKALRLLERRTGRIMGDLGAPGTHFAFSPDGRLVVAGDALYDVATGGKLRQIEGVEVESGGAQRFSCDGTLLRFSRDGKRILWKAVPLDHGPSAVAVCDVATGKALWRGPGHGSLIEFSADGHLAVVLDKDAVVVYNAVRGTQVRRIRGRFDSAALSPDGQHVLLGEWEPIVRLVNVPSGRLVWRRHISDDAVYRHFVLPGTHDSMLGKTKLAAFVSFSADGGAGYGGWACGSAAWDVPSGNRLGTVNAHSGIVSPDGRTVLVGDALRELRTGRAPKHLRSVVQRVEAVGFTSDGQHLTIAGERLSLCDWTTGVVVRAEGLADRAGQWAFAADGGCAAEVDQSDHAVARLWDVVSGKLLWQGHGSGEASTCAAQTGLSPTWVGEQLFLLDKTRSRQLSALGMAWGNAVAVAADTLMVANRYGISIKSLATGKEFRRLAGDEFGAELVALSPDGRWAIAANRFQAGRPCGARVWDTSTGKAMGEFACQASAVALAPDGRYALVSGSGIPDGTEAGNSSFMVLWTIGSGAAPQRLPSGDAQTKSLAFSPDDRLAVGAEADGSVRLWDVASSRLLCTYFALQDGGWIVSDTEGHYDASNPTDLPGIGWARGLETEALGARKAEAWMPGLLAKVIRGAAQAGVPEHR